MSVGRVSEHTPHSGSRLTSAPCLTKSTWSSSMGVSRSRASLLAVPAQDMPTAIQAPHRTWGGGGRRRGELKISGGEMKGDRGRV